MSSPSAPITRAGGVLTVSFNRPAKLNSVNDEMLSALRAAADQLATDDELRVLVIRAEGEYFTAGLDLGSKIARSLYDETAHPDLHFRRIYRGLHSLFDDFESIEKPVILVAQGRCFGVGLEMAVSCDFRFASTRASFALPEVHIGVLAGSGGTSRLTRLVGPHWGKWLAMAGQEVSAERALQIGLVHDVVAPDQLDERVDAFIDQLISIPAQCLGLAKLAVDMCADSDRTTQRHVERIANTSRYASDDFFERTTRFRNPS